MSSSTVSQIGGNSIVISTGESNYVLNDKNNNGQIDDGDLFVRTKQGDASVATWVVGKDEGLYAWGDPHLDNFALTDDRKQALTVALQAAFEDAKEGPLVNQGLLNSIDQALPSHGQRKNILDFHDNIALIKTDGTRVEFDVAKRGNVAFTENVDIHVVDAEGKERTLTITEIWAGNGGAGQSGVKETTNNDGEQAVKGTEAENLHVFHEYEGANVINGVAQFGDDAGTPDYAKVVDVNGVLNLSFGQVTLEAVGFYDRRLRAEDHLLMQGMRLGGFDDDEEEGIPNSSDGKVGNNNILANT